MINIYNSSTLKFISQVRCSQVVVHSLNGNTVNKTMQYFLFQPVLHNWGNKGHGMYYPVCEMEGQKCFI